MDLTQLFGLVDTHVAEGRFPGAVVTVRHAGQTHVHATQSLITDGTLDPAADVARRLPELADLHVLVHPIAELGTRVPARGPVTVADLLPMTAGFGLQMDAATGVRCPRRCSWRSTRTPTTGCTPPGCRRRSR